MKLCLVLILSFYVQLGFAQEEEDLSLFDDLSAMESDLEDIDSEDKEEEEVEDLATSNKEDKNSQATADEKTQPAVQKDDSEPDSAEDSEAVAEEDDLFEKAELESLDKPEKKIVKPTVHPTKKSKEKKLKKIIPTELENIVIVKKIILSPKDKKILKLIDYIGLRQFIFMITKLQGHQVPQGYFEVENEIKVYFERYTFWKSFNIEQFETEFKKRLKDNFTELEIDNLNKKFYRPFYAKMIKKTVLNRDIFGQYYAVLDDSYITNVASDIRKKQINNIYNIHGLDFQKSNLESRLQYFIKKEATMTLESKIVNSGTRMRFSTQSLSDNLSNVKEFVLNSLTHDLEDVRLFELNEYLRTMKGEGIHKFLQFYTNFHYLYITKQIRMLEEDKKNGHTVIIKNVKFNKFVEEPKEGNVDNQTSPKK
ncbi:MAG: hypothetical protein HON90_04445 [Halobacteriovoraceae bacterium]|jgi:hypothetical protein|nr:hypothetical protein [Halobacteriovoraceae bacterium]